MTVTIPQLLDIVRTKYTDNPAVLAMADCLVTAQNMARITSHGMFKTDILAGYERASIAETHERADGYSPLLHMQASMLESELKRMNALHEVGVITMCLVCVLQRLGEDIAF